MIETRKLVRVTPETERTIVEARQQGLSYEGVRSKVKLVHLRSISNGAISNALRKVGILKPFAKRSTKAPTVSLELPLSAKQIILLNQRKKVYKLVGGKIISIFQGATISRKRTVRRIKTLQGQIKKLEAKLSVGGGEELS